MAMDFPDKSGAMIRKLTQRDGRTWGEWVSNYTQHDLSREERESLDAAIHKHRTHTFIHADHMEMIINSGGRRGMRRPKFEKTGYDRKSRDPDRDPLKWFWLALENPKRQRHREARENQKVQIAEMKARLEQLERENAQLRKEREADAEKFRMMERLILIMDRQAEVQPVRTAHVVRLNA